MCSVGDEVEEPENAKFMPEKPKLNLGENTCMKCTSDRPQIVLHSKYPYCKTCFIASTVHKFKALLGKNRVVHPNDNVLICHKPGHPSTALLHFLRSGLDLTTPKKIRFNPIVVYIEQHVNLSLQQRKRILQQINEEVTRCNFSCYYVSLTQYVLDPDSLNLLQDFHQVALNENDATKIKSVIKKKGNVTMQRELLKIFERKLLISTAKLLKCSSIFTPDLGMDIASQLLTSISLGRGAHTALDIGIIDSRDDVKLLTPLRNFTMKELAFYNIFNSLESVSFLSAAQNPYASVQSLMEKFVSDLQVNYPATVSTIVRTGDKLWMDKTLEQNRKCPLCKAPTEGESSELRSAEATNFSHWVSTQAANDGGDSIEQHSTQLLERFKNSRDFSHCFACSRIINFL